MADMTKVEEGNAFPNKRKLDLPDPINETLEQKDDVKQDGSDSNKRQKLEISTENEKNITSSFTDVEKMAAENRADEKDNKDNHVMGEAGIVDTGERITLADKGKGLLIEESEEEEDDSDDYDSSDDSSDDDSSDDSTDYSTYDSSDGSFFSDKSCDDSDSSELSGDSDSESIRYY